MAQMVYRNDLWSAIYELYEELVKKNNREASYQSLFERNPVIFHALGYDGVQSFATKNGPQLPFDPDRGYRPEPDFICVKRNPAEIIIFDLKTPFVKTPTIARGDGNREKFRAEVESYLSQVSEYVDSIRERDAARKVLRNIFGVERVGSYSIVLLYGLSSNFDQPAVSRLLENRKTRTEIRPFDSLLTYLISVHSVSAECPDMRPGFSGCWYLVLSPRPSEGRGYIFDIGSTERDRVSLYVQGGSLIAECIDSDGLLHRLHSHVVPNQPTYVRLEYATDNVGTFILLNLNNIDFDFRYSEKSFQLNLNLDQLTVGADLAARNRGRFRLLEQYIIGSTMGVQDRLGSYYHFRRRLRNDGPSLEFNGSSYMYREIVSGALIQEDLDACPVHRASAYYSEI